MPLIYDKLRSLRTIIARAMSSKGSKNLAIVLGDKIKDEREKLQTFRKLYGKQKVAEITINDIYGGLRGIITLPCELSHVDHKAGVSFRGHSLVECMENLPKIKGTCQPLPEGIFWLLLTGDIPNDEQVKCLSEEWENLRCIPNHVQSFLNQVPSHVPSISQLSAAITLMGTESRFSRAVEAGVKKEELWQTAFDDSMYLIANITEIAAIIYARLYRKEKLGTEQHNTDWSANFASRLGFPDPLFADMMRLMLTLHCDHETGNVSAHTVHLVSSALTNPFLSFASGINGLAGPLHGGAAQSVMTFLHDLQKELGSDATEENVAQYVRKVVDNRQIIPGYGHALLRDIDPRFSQIRNFCLRYYPDNKLVQLTEILIKVVPPTLKAGGKVQNPFPNVDGYSGVAWQCAGLTESDFTLIIFAVSRSLGVLANYVWNRAMLMPILRPRSSNIENFCTMIAKEGSGPGPGSDHGSRPDYKKSK